jgi:hypothetical protein
MRDGGPRCWTLRGSERRTNKSGGRGGAKVVAGTPVASLLALNAAAWGSDEQQKPEGNSVQRAGAMPSPGMGL